MLFKLLKELARRDGAIPIVGTQWKHQIDENWSVEANGIMGNFMSFSGVSPLTIAIDYRGKNVGLIGLNGYQFNEQGTATEQALIRALQRKMGVAS